MKSAKEKMQERKKKLSERGSGSGLLYPKEGTMRIRLKNPGDDEELGIEVITFYRGRDKGSIISPATFNEPCPWMEKFKQLKESSDPADKELAKTLVPRHKFVIGGDVYKDEKGREWDEEKQNKGIQVGNGVYQDIVDLYLDEDEWGDMTDRDEGYDIKITREGKGLTDTKYSVKPCSKKKVDKPHRTKIDLEAIVRAQILTYDELEVALKEFIGDDSEEDDEEPKTKKKSIKDKKKKKKGSSKKYDDDLPF